MGNDNGREGTCISIALWVLLTVATQALFAQRWPFLNDVPPLSWVLALWP